MATGCAPWADRRFDNILQAGMVRCVDIFVDSGDCGDCHDCWHATFWCMVPVLVEVDDKVLLISVGQYGFICRFDGFLQIVRYIPTSCCVPNKYQYISNSSDHRICGDGGRSTSTTTPTLLRNSSIRSSRSKSNSSKSRR